MKISLLLLLLLFNFSAIAENERIQRRADPPDISPCQKQIINLRQALRVVINELQAANEQVREFIERERALIERDTLTAPQTNAAVFATPVSPTRRNIAIENTEAAKKEAANWLAATGQSGLTVGAVKKTGWVYVVNIVTSNAPQELRNQLIIRRLDGFYISVH